MGRRYLIGLICLGPGFLPMTSFARAASTGATQYYNFTSAAIDVEFTPNESTRNTPTTTHKSGPTDSVTTFYIGIAAGAAFFLLLISALLVSRGCNGSRRRERKGSKEDKKGADVEEIPVAPQSCQNVAFDSTDSVGEEQKHGNSYADVEDVTLGMKTFLGNGIADVSTKENSAVETREYVNVTRTVTSTSDTTGLDSRNEYSEINCKPVNQLEITDVTIHHYSDVVIQNERPKEKQHTVTNDYSEINVNPGRNDTGNLIYDPYDDVKFTAEPSKNECHNDLPEPAYSEIVTTAARGKQNVVTSPPVYAIPQKGTSLKKMEGKLSDQVAAVDALYAKPQKKSNIMKSNPLSSKPEQDSGVEPVYAKPQKDKTISKIVGGRSGAELIDNGDDWQTTEQKKVAEKTTTEQTKNAEHMYAIPHKPKGKKNTGQGK